MRIKLILFVLLLLSGSRIFSQIANYGAVNGSVLDSLSGQPVEFASVTLINALKGDAVTGAVTGRQGYFSINNVPFGKYNVKITYIGYKTKESNNILVDAAHKKVDLGKYYLNNTGVTLNETVVTSNKIMLNNSIDRKVYNVQQDVLSATGTASDLLQNIPSVQVDIEGNVSLRGSEDVTILINGSPSPLMGRTRADALRQIQASTIEKIEVITNPSAKYKPDGTSGIINIVMKKDASAGLNGNVSLNAGNKSRYNANLSLNYKPGRLNLFGSAGIRKDGRDGFSSDRRTQFDSLGNCSGYYFNETGNPIKFISASFTLGAEYSFSESTSAGLSGNYMDREKNSDELASYLLSDKNRKAVSGYDRLGGEDENEKEYGLTAFFEHKFDGDENKLRIQFNGAVTPETENNKYRNVYKIPAADTQYENTLLDVTQYTNQLEIQYSKQLSEKSFLEAGYAGEYNKNDMDYSGEYYDAAKRSFVVNSAVTNHFVDYENIHAAYISYANTLGRFGLLAGMRGEGSFIKADLVSSGRVYNNDYYSLYPTLHLSYKLTEMLQFQLNYSKRARRPEGDDLNPFPEYEDPRNIRAGNPELKPEYIHSYEFGIQWNNKLFTVIPSLFYRRRYNAMTTVTKAVNDSTLLTTKENLASNESAGLEVVLSGGSELLTINLSAMAFNEKIDASNLGFGKEKSTTTWSGNLSCNINLPASFMMQINSNYRSKRLTPQGEYSPSFVLNLGLRKDILDNKATLVVTVSDLFKTLNRKLDFNTQWLKQNTYNVRDTRIFYFGVTYHIGGKSKKGKELQYDNSL